MATGAVLGWLKEIYLPLHHHDWPSWTYNASSTSNITDLDERTSVDLLEMFRSLPPLGSAAHLGLATGFLLTLVLNAKLDVSKERQWAEVVVARLVTAVLSLILAAVLLPAAGLLLLVFSGYRQLASQLLRVSRRTTFAGLLEGTDTLWAIETRQARSVISVLALVQMKEADGPLLLSKLRELARERLLASAPEKLLLLRRKSVLGYFYWEKRRPGTPEEGVLEERVRWLTDTAAPTTAEELRALVSSLCNAPLPEEHAAGWEILVGQGPLRQPRPDVVLTMEEGGCDSRQAVFPVLFRVHHSMGDGVSLLHLLLDALAGPGPTSETDNQGRATPIIAKVPTLEAMPATTEVPRSPTPQSSRPSTPFQFSIDSTGAVSYNPNMPKKLTFLPVSVKPCSRPGSPFSRPASPVSRPHSPVPPYISGKSASYRSQGKILNGQKPFRPHSPLSKFNKLHFYNGVDNFISFPDDLNNCSIMEGRNTTIYYYNTGNGVDHSVSFDGECSPLRCHSPCGSTSDYVANESGRETPAPSDERDTDSMAEAAPAPRLRPRLSLGSRARGSEEGPSRNRYVSLLRQISGDEPAPRLGWATTACALLFSPTSLLHQALMRASDLNLLHGTAPLSGEKTAAWRSEPSLLEDVRRIRSRIPGTHFTDVALAALSAAMEKHFGATSPLSVTTVLPCRMDASLPGKTAGEVELQNRFSVGLLSLPVSAPAGERKWSSTSRLREVTRQMDILRRSPDCQINYWLMRVVAGLLPTPLLMPLIRSTQSTLVVSNMRGPASSLPLGGGDVKDLVFWVPHRDSTGVGVSILSYAGGLQLGLVLDKALTRAPEDAERLLADMVAELRALDADTAASVAH